MLRVLAGLAGETWGVFLVAAPFLLIGLLAGGLLHVLLSPRLVERWMGDGRLRGAAVGALFGIPLPLCSCSVVPVALALRRKGASPAATASFLITTPESGADSILLTYGMLGPVMAVARPLASFVTAMLAGAGARATAQAALPSSTAAVPAADHHHHRHADPPDAERHAVGVQGQWSAVCRWIIRWRPGGGSAPHRPRPFERIAVDVARYAFVDLLDDIAFWLVIGLVSAALIGRFVPADLGATGLGNGILPMLVVLLAGIPLYICASASTPVAAALVAKGLSPGAALVFLLAGPGTNAATLVVLTRVFGVGFVRVYVGSIALGAVVCGVTLDAILAVTGWQVAVTLDGGAGDLAPVQWLSAGLLAALLLWRLWAGAARRGLRELVENTRALLRFVRPATGSSRPTGRWGGTALVLLGTAGCLAGGAPVPPATRCCRACADGSWVEAAAPALFADPPPDTSRSQRNLPDGRA